MFNRMRGVLVVVLAIVVCKCNGANILFATEMLSPSHKIFNFALIEGLVKKGHNVTFLHPPVIMNMGKGLNNYHPIYLEGMEEYSEQKLVGLASTSTLDMMYFFYDYINFCCQNVVKSPGLQILLDYPKNFKFDLILYDNTNSNCLLPLIERFNYPPTIAVTAFLLPYYMSMAFGNSLHPSYLPFFGVRYTDRMDFFERVANYFWMNLDSILRYILVDKNVEEIARGRFGPHMASMSTLEQHISLLFCNLDAVYHHPQPLTPNIIPIGGMHVKPARPLPKDLLQIADNAKDGLILFALGTNIRSDRLGNDKIEAILDALARVKLTVIWKFESNLSQFTVPQNVHTRKWVPQSDILAHPNIKLFISHGGALSTIEATYYGVPVIGIPFVVDQHANIMMMEQKNLGLQLEYNDITSDRLFGKIEEVLKNPRYTNAIKETSRKMRDRPQTPLETAIFWTEYSMRHNGTHFLNPRSRSMSRFVSTSADVQLFLLFTIAFSLTVIVYVCKLLIFGKKQIVKEKYN